MQKLLYTIQFPYNPEYLEIWDQKLFGCIISIDILSNIHPYMRSYNYSIQSWSLIDNLSQKEVQLGCNAITQH